MAGATQVIGGTLKAFGTLVQSEATASAAEFNASIARQNAKIARARGQVQEAAFRRRARQFRGAQTAAFGASGVTLEGSPLDVLESTALDQELDALLIRNQADLQIRGFRNTALLESKRAKITRRVGKFQAATQLFSSLSGAGGGPTPTLGGT